MDTQYVVDGEKALPLPGRAERQRAREAAITKVKTQAKQKRDRLQFIEREIASANAYIKKLERERKALSRDFREDVQMIAQLQSRR